MPIYAEVYKDRAVPTVTGYVISDPEDRKVSDKLSVLSFRVSSSSKTGNYPPKVDAFGADVDKVKGWYADLIVSVELKFDQRTAFLGKIKKGDRVKIYGTIRERAYRNKEGKLGRSLEFAFIDNIEILDNGQSSDSGNASAGEAIDPWTM